jgi:hypothetical protein
MGIRFLSISCDFVRPIQVQLFRIARATWPAGDSNAHLSVAQDLILRYLSKSDAGYFDPNTI